MSYVRILKLYKKSPTVLHFYYIYSMYEKFIGLLKIQNILLMLMQERNLMVNIFA